MSDHEFEKQVQQKLDELKLRPSTAVWTEVEKNIRHAKRRRRFIFWLPVFFLFLATSGYVWYTSNQPTAAIAKATHNTPATATTQSTATATTAAQPTKSVQETQTPTSAPAAEPASSDEATPSIQSTTIPSSNSQITHTENNSTLIPSVKDHAAVKEKRIVTRLNSNKHQSKHYTASPDQQNVVIPQEEEAPYIAYPQIAQTENNISTNQAVPNSLTGQPANIFTPEKQNTTAAAPVPPIQKQQGPKWQWGIAASAGYSRISQSSLFELNGLLGSTEKNLVEDLARSAAPPSNNAFSGQYISPAPPAEKKAAPVQPDFAWSGGLYVQRPLSKRLRLTIGLQYTYMSASTTIGKLIQKSAMVNQGTSSATVVDRYYTSFDFRDSTQPAITNATYAVPDTNIARKYAFRFHALEVPVLLSWQINKGRRLPPFVLDAGFSVLHLLSFDALHYDGIKNIYYKEDRLINTTQFNAIMGLNVGLLQQSKTPVWIGPYLRYSLTNLVKKEVSKGQFLWSAGVNVRVGLGRL